MIRLSTEPTNVRFEPDTLVKLKRAAEREGRSVSSMVRKIVKDALEAEAKGAPHE